MVMDRTDKEIIFRLPLDYSPIEAQEVIDYLRFTSIKSKNEVTDEQIEELSNEVDAKIWEKLNAKNNLQGILSHYASPDLRKLEKNALEDAIASKWE